MFRKIILPILAFLGIFLAIFIVYFSRKKEISVAIAFPPATPSFEHFVAGGGIIEPASENIEIGVPFPDLVEKVSVSSGDIVKKGDLLFQLDTRQLISNLKTAQEEERRAFYNFEDKKTKFSFYKSIYDKRSISKEKFSEVYFEMQKAEKEYQASLARIKEIETKIQRSYILAPMDGEVLQVNVKKGEFANVNPFDKRPLILFGDTNFFHVRVDVDEEESWRVKKDAEAVAYVRGNANIKIPLEFVKIEPYVIAKVALTGENQERVDTRVLQIIYKFKKKNLPVYMGQLLDVYIKAD